MNTAPSGFAKDVFLFHIAKRPCSRSAFFDPTDGASNKRSLGSTGISGVLRNMKTAAYYKPDSQATIWP
jgi:hypothetical protein